MDTLNKKLRHPFIWKAHLAGWSAHLQKVGTGMKASVTVKLLHLAENKRPNYILDKLRLQMEVTGMAKLIGGSVVQSHAGIMQPQFNIKIELGCIQIYIHFSPSNI